MGTNCIPAKCISHHPQRSNFVGGFRNRVSQPVVGDVPLRQVCVFTRNEMDEIQLRATMVERLASDREEARRKAERMRQERDCLVDNMSNTVHTARRALVEDLKKKRENNVEKLKEIHIEEELIKAEDRKKVLEKAKALIQRNQPCSRQLDSIFRESEMIATWDVQVERKKGKKDIFGELWMEDETKGIGKMRDESSLREQKLKSSEKHLVKDWTAKTEELNLEKARRKQLDLAEMCQLKENVVSLKKCEEERSAENRNKKLQIIEFNKKLHLQQLTDADRAARIAEEQSEINRQHAEKKRADARALMNKKIEAFKARENQADMVRCRLSEMAKQEEDGLSAKMKRIECENELHAQRQANREHVERLARRQFHEQFGEDLTRQRQLKMELFEKEKWNVAEDLRIRMEAANELDRAELQKQQNRQQVKKHLSDLYQIETGAKKEKERCLRKEDRDYIKKVIDEEKRTNVACATQALQVKSEIEERDWSVHSINKMLKNIEVEGKVLVDADADVDPAVAHVQRASNSYARLGFKVYPC